MIEPSAGCLDAEATGERAERTNERVAVFRHWLGDGKWGAGPACFSGNGSCGYRQVVTVKVACCRTSPDIRSASGHRGSLIGRISNDAALGR